MTPSIETSSTLQDKLAELKETQEREKVELSPDVEKYYQEHVEAIQEKLAKGEKLLESDFNFIKEIKFWIMSHEDFREKFPSLEKILKYKKECDKRKITLKQWFDLLMIVGGLNLLNEVIDGRHIRERIDIIFKFENGKIIAKELDYDHRTDPASLPDGLEVTGSLLLNYCNKLITLPENLKVGGLLKIHSCTNLTHLPAGLDVGSTLMISDSIKLVSLPEDIKIGEDLILSDCINLTHLPLDLELNKISLGRNLKDQVKQDAARLKKEGKIKEIKYSS